MLGSVLNATVIANSTARRVASSAAESALPNFESPNRKPCPLSPSEYLTRIQRYTHMSPCNMLVAVIYLQRLKDKLAASGPVRLSPCNCQRLLLCANMLASKFFDDHYVSNKQWAMVGDLKTAELNLLEVEMLTALAFDLNVTREDYNDNLATLLKILSSLPPDKRIAESSQPEARLKPVTPDAGRPHTTTHRASTASAALSPTSSSSNTTGGTLGEPNGPLSSSSNSVSSSTPSSLASTPAATPNTSPVKLLHQRRVPLDADLCSQDVFLGSGYTQARKAPIKTLHHAHVVECAPLAKVRGSWGTSDTASIAPHTRPSRANATVHAHVQTVQQSAAVDFVRKGYAQSQGAR